MEPRRDSSGGPARRSHHRWGHRAAEPPRSDRQIGAASFRWLSRDGSGAFLGTPGVSEAAEVECWRRRAACGHDVLVDRHPWALPTTADFWLGAGHDPSAGDEPSHTRVSCAGTERMTPNQQQGQAGPFPCVLGEGDA